MKEFFDKKELLQYMKNNGCKNLSKMENIATMPTSNFGGMVIMVNRTGESVFVQSVWDTNQGRIEECEILYTESGTPYFELEGEPYYINEFMKRR